MNFEFWSTSLKKLGFTVSGLALFCATTVSADTPQPTHVAPTIKYRNLVPAPRKAMILPQSKDLSIPSKGLRWDSNPVQIVQVASVGDSVPRLFAELRGNYSNPTHQLLIGYKLVKTSSDGTFSLTLPITRERQKISLIWIDDHGTVLTSETILYVPGYNSYVSQLTSSSPVQGSVWATPTFSWSIVSGPSYLTYAQTQRTDLSQTALSLKVSAQWRPLRSLSQLELGTNAFGNVLPLTTSEPGVSFRVVGGNLRLGYDFPISNSRWSIGAAAGVSIQTMLASGGNFGFELLAYPQLYPTLRLRLNDRDLLGTYFKYVPMGESPFSLSSTDREISAGLTWIHSLDLKKAIQISLDASSMKYKPTAQSEVGLSSLSLNAGIGFQ